jgi:hypothetical protein
LDFGVLDVLVYRPYECSRNRDLCISFHKGTLPNTTYGQEKERCPFFISEIESFEHIDIECQEI